MEDTLYAYPQGNTMSGGNSGGMTLRDAFAMHAFGAVMSQATGLGSMNMSERSVMWTQVAALIYEGVDAMLEIRDQRK
jgi:hypothetical protein